VIATPSLGHDQVNARSDDLLALQSEQRLQLELSGKAEPMTRVKSSLETLTSNSKTVTKCSLVRPVNPPTVPRWKEREREMAEIRHFLDRGWSFTGLESGLCQFMPGSSPELDAWLLEFFRGVYNGHNFKSDQCLFDERCRLVSQYVALRDEDMLDEEGAVVCLVDIKRDRRSSKFVPDRGWVQSSSYSYNLGQCERTSGLSHVVDGGGDALEPASLSCERTSGPSHVEDGGGDAAQRSYCETEDRSSLVQSLGSLAGSDSHNVGTVPEDPI
jgi:hypothetical protein